MTQVDQRPSSTFTTQELARLQSYRAAVAAGFFSDWDGSAPRTDTDTETLAWLRPEAEAGDGYPFTAEERQHLETVRDALGRGDYADDVPPPAVPKPAPETAERPATGEDSAR